MGNTCEGEANQQEADLSKKPVTNIILNSFNRKMHHFKLKRVKKKSQCVQREDLTKFN